MIPFFKKHWLICLLGFSLTFNLFLGYFCYQYYQLATAPHEKNIIKKEVLDYDNFKEAWGQSWIGLEVTYVKPEDALRVQIDRPEGALITKIANNSPAQKANMEVGDVILSFNGRKIRTPQQLQSDLYGSEIDEEVYMCVAKEGYRTTIYIVPQPMPSYLDVPLKSFSWLGAKVSEVAFGSEEAQLVEEADKTGGVLVDEVFPDSPAERAGLQKDDIIMSANNRKARTLREFLSDIAGLQVGDQLSLCIIRGDIRKTIYVYLEHGQISTEI